MNNFYIFTFIWIHKDMSLYYVSFYLFSFIKWLIVLSIYLLLHFLACLLKTSLWKRPFLLWIIIMTVRGLNAPLSLLSIEHFFRREVPLIFLSNIKPQSRTQCLSQLLSQGNFLSALENLWILWINHLMDTTII